MVCNKLASSPEVTGDSSYTWTNIFNTLTLYVYLFLFSISNSWTNPLPDIVVCDQCRATLAISFHPKLESSHVQRIASVYRERLCTSHQETCPFFAKAFPDAASNTNTTTDVPPYLASALPDETVELMEHPAPRNLVVKRIQVWKDMLIGSDRTIPELDMSSSKGFRDYVRDNHSEETIKARIAQACGIQAVDKDLAMLALLGWTPVESSSLSESSAVVRAECTTCLAQAELSLQKTSHRKDKEDEPPPPKKPRRKPAMNPLSAHRHYCPFLCGFPVDKPAVPMWQNIVTNLLQAVDDEPRVDQHPGQEAQHKGEAALAAVQQLLRSGLAKRQDTTASTQ